MNFKINYILNFLKKIFLLFKKEKKSEVIEPYLDTEENTEPKIEPTTIQENFSFDKKPEPELKTFKFKLPTLDFLKQPTKKERENSSEIKVDGETLEKILLDFGVEGKINKISNGPVVTLNEFEPAPGVKVSKIINLSEDIARNTSSESARIATIPGSSSIGIELPKSSRENVYLSEIISSNEFSKKNIKLPIALGKSISGMPITGDLSAMPHLLIAGTTGSGKSVCINTIILSLLYRHSPDKCKFILIDPKMLELSTYEGIPHLLCPVITEAKRAASVLGWVVKEMESSSIGIELPKSSRENVYLSEIISSNEFSKKNIKLPIALGKSISGMPITGDLSAMPHLLIAGTTGSGKSVCINTIILSLLYRHSPDKCKFILIDPKMLELSTYEGIPHLLCPVITEAKRAASVLGWVVKEMESRYRLMTREGVRNIDGYNEKHKLSMPYIVVIVDEMSDLMLVAGKEIENYIQKLSQMARAAGIHIIMATQRPSVDVITGTIKANFPTRISFQVTSKIDSRTILGEQGAEQLLGKGDMLYMSSANRIVRIHAPFVSENEIEKINNFLRNQAEPDYVDEILNFADEKDTKSSNKDDENLDELYETALEIIKSERKASTSFLQRKLQIGYNRAARIIDQMESNGEVSKANHVGKREVLK